MDPASSNPTPDTARETGAHALAEALQTSFRLLRWMVVLLLTAYLLSGLFLVRQHERAIVLRLGRIEGIGATRVKEPGLHWTWPRPFARVLRVETERVQTIASDTFWHRNLPDAELEIAAPTGNTLKPELDGYLLTGDANILHARWALRFTITDPERWLFTGTDPESLMLRALDSAIMRQAAARPIDDVLHREVAGLREAVETDVTARLRTLELGVSVQGLDLVGIAPPPQVAQAFDAVIQAEQQRGQRISEARARAAALTSTAAGEAARIRSEGETAKRKLLTEIEADADRFQQMRAAWQRNPDVLRETLRQDAARRALAGVERKFFVQGDRAAQEWRLQFGPEARRAEAVE